MLALDETRERLYGSRVIYQVGEFVARNSREHLRNHATNSSRRGGGATDSGTATAGSAAETMIGPKLPR